MARAPKTEKIEELPPGVLPVPKIVVEHHARTLTSPMREWATQKRVPPVLLLVGTSGVGKRSMAYYLAQWIFCEKSGFRAKSALLAVGTSSSGEEGGDLFGGMLTEAAEPSAKPGDLSPFALEGPCGECVHCQKALRGNWVDFTEITPEDEDSDALKVDQFRDLKAKLGFGAHEGPYRIILIPNADRMTVQAANSMLKLLEEPPPGWVFFLTASDPALMLPTILSRCQTLRLKPFMAPALRSLLQDAGITGEKQRICADLAQGSWSKAIALADEESWEKRKELFKFLESPQAMLNPLVDWATQDNTNFNLLVDQLEQVTAELVRWSAQPDASKMEWVSADGRTALTQHAKTVVQRKGGVDRARAFWLERAKRLAQVRQESLAPLNRKLLVQDLLLPWISETSR